MALESPRASQESSATPQFKSINSSAHITTRKTIALTIWTFVSKVMSLLFNMLCRYHSFTCKQQVSFNVDA